jgi:hypothetical protein
MSAVEAVTRHVVLVAAALALGATGWRVAARAGADGLTRLVAAATFAVTLAVLEALVLGLVGIGSPVVLTVAAVLGWLAVRALVAPPRRRALDDLAAWWAQRRAGERAAAGAGAAASVSWVVWQLRYPHISVDGLVYHLPLVASWVPDGAAGAPSELVVGLPVGNYPITHEVALYWATAVGGSWAPAVVAAPLMLVVLVSAAWSGLRALGADPRVAGLATAAIATLPVVVGQLNAVGTDLPALVWLAATASLAVASAARPALVPFVLLAAGLSVGTKTTTIVLAGAVVVLALWAARRRLCSTLAPLGFAAAAALGTGAVWPMRNLVDHGSPLWPFQSWPGGDPIPPAFEAIDDAFIDHPGAMLDGRVGDYLEVLGGGALLLVAALVLPPASRGRRALVAAGIVAAALIAWMFAPYTGIARSTDLAVGATRYLLPCLAAAAVAVALSARGRTYWFAVGALALAAAWSVQRDARLGFPLTPTVLTLALPAALGALAAVRLPSAGLRWLAAALPVAGAVVLAVAAPSMVERHARVAMFDAPLLDALTRDASFTGSGRDMAMAPATVALAAGDAVQHDLQLIPPDEPCAAVRGRLSRGWVVLQLSPPTATAQRVRACLRGMRPVHVDPVYELYARR